MLWRPMAGGLTWTGAGVGAGAFLPSVLASSSMVYSTPIIATSLWGGALLVLLPLGVTRGIISSVQEILQLHGRPALQQAMDDFKLGSSSQFVTTKEGNQQLLERLTLGSGWQGRMVRTLASPFLPSTSQMMVRLQELVEKEAATTAAGEASVTLDSHVLVAAVDGFVEGFLQDKKDTLTMLGLLGYAGILGIGFGVDYSYRRASEWNQERIEAKPDSKPIGSEDRTKGGMDFKAMQQRLGLPHSRANQQLESELEAQQKQEAKAKAAAAAVAAAATANQQATQDKPLSIRETLDAAQLQVGELTKWLLKSKQQAYPYFQQAWDVVGTVKDEVGDQAARVFQQAKQVIMNEENQDRFQQQWKHMVDTMQEFSPDDKTLGRMTKDMEDILQQAKKRLNEEDVQEMRKDLEQAISQAKERIAEEKEKAKVNERLEQATAGIQARLWDWWNDRRK